MAYTPKNWADGEAGGTPINATELNRIEAGIAAGSVDNALYPRYVAHGSDVNVARPAGAGLVIWIGNVTPVNMANGDVRISTA